MDTEKAQQVERPDGSTFVSMGGGHVYKDQPGYKVREVEGHRRSRGFEITKGGKR